MNERDRLTSISGRRERDCSWELVRATGRSVPNTNEYGTLCSYK